MRPSDEEKRIVHELPRPNSPRPLPGSNRPGNEGELIDLGVLETLIDAATAKLNTIRTNSDEELQCFLFRNARLIFSEIKNSRAAK